MGIFRNCFFVVSAVFTLNHLVKADAANSAAIGVGNSDEAPVSVSQFNNLPLANVAAGAVVQATPPEVIELDLNSQLEQKRSLLSEQVLAVNDLKANSNQSPVSIQQQEMVFASSNLKLLENIEHPAEPTDNLVLVQALLPGAIAPQVAQVNQKTTPNPAPSTPAPSNLNSNPNPLEFPTQADEVKIGKIQPITLRQAIELARRNNRQIQIAELELKRNRLVVQEQQAALYPTLGVNGTLTRSLSAGGDIQSRAFDRQNQEQLRNLPGQIAATQSALTQLQNNIPNPLIDPLGFTESQIAIAQANQQLNSLLQPQVTRQNFATTNFSGGLELNYNIFTSGRRNALIRASEEQVRSSEIEVERLIEQTRLDVSIAYYDLQQADQQISIEEAALREAARSLSDAELRLEAGLATRLDVLNAQVQLDSAEQRRRRAISQQQINRRQLAQLLSLPRNAEISAADPVEPSGNWNLSLEESIVRGFQNRGELEQQLIQRNINREQRRIALADLGPQVSVFASYDLAYANTDAPDSPSQGFQARGFGSGYSLGLRVRWDLFDGGRTRARAAQEETNMEIAETRFADTSNQIRFQIERAYSDLQSNRDNIDVARRALATAEEALNISRLRFQAGVGVQTDVLNAETRLTEARGNLIQAILGYNRAIAQLQRSVSNLPSSNLNRVR